MCDLGLPCGKLDCPCSGALWVKMFRLSGDWTPAAPPFPTASIRWIGCVRPRSSCVLTTKRFHTLSATRARKPAFATSSRPSLNAWSCRNTATRLATDAELPFATSSSCAISSGESSIVAASRFSRRCATEDVPGTSKILGNLWRSHASATCTGFA